MKTIQSFIHSLILQILLEFLTHVWVQLWTLGDNVEQDSKGAYCQGDYTPVQRNRQ